MKQLEEKDFYTVRDLAHLLFFSERTIRDMLKRGEIKGVQLKEKGTWRIPRVEVDRLLSEQKTVENLLGVATQLKTQLVLPPPELISIDDFGDPGRHSISLEQDIFKVLFQNLGYDINKFEVYKESSTTSHTPINIEVSDYGVLELFCPVETHQLFPKLLASLPKIGEQFTVWKQLGGQCLTKCRDIRQEIHTEASNSTFQSAYETAVRFLPRILKPSELPPSPLTPNFANFIYRLSILYQRTSGQCGLPGIEQYITRPRHMFLELYLGQIHLASVPNFLPPPIFYTSWAQFLRGWIDLHRNMIRKCGLSPAIIELLELFKSLRRIGATIKHELDNAIRNK